MDNTKPLERTAADDCTQHLLRTGPTSPSDAHAQTTQHQQQGEHLQLMGGQNSQGQDRHAGAAPIPPWPLPLPVPLPLPPHQPHQQVEQQQQQPQQQGQPHQAGYDSAAPSASGAGEDEGSGDMSDDGYEAQEGGGDDMDCDTGVGDDDAPGMEQRPGAEQIEFSNEHVAAWRRAHGSDGGLGDAGAAQLGSSDAGEQQEQQQTGRKQRQRRAPRQYDDQAEQPATTGKGQPPGLINAVNNITVSADFIIRQFPAEAAASPSPTFSIKLRRQIDGVLEDQVLDAHIKDYRREGHRRGTFRIVHCPGVKRGIVGTRITNWRYEDGVVVMEVEHVDPSEAGQPEGSQQQADEQQQDPSKREQAEQAAAPGKTPAGLGIGKRKSTGAASGTGGKRQRKSIGPKLIEPAGSFEFNTELLRELRVPADAGMPLAVKVRYELDGVLARDEDGSIKETAARLCSRSAIDNKNCYLAGAGLRKLVLGMYLIGWGSSWAALPAPAEAAEGSGLEAQPAADGPSSGTDGNPWLLLRAATAAPSEPTAGVAAAGTGMPASPTPSSLAATLMMLAHASQRVALGVQDTATRPENVEGLESTGRGQESEQDFLDAAGTMGEGDGRGQEQRNRSSSGAGGAPRGHDDPHGDAAGGQPGVADTPATGQPKRRKQARTPSQRTSGRKPSDGLPLSSPLDVMPAPRDGLHHPDRISAAMRKRHVGRTRLPERNNKGCKLRLNSQLRIVMFGCEDVPETFSVQVQRCIHDQLEDKVFKGVQLIDKTVAKDGYRIKDPASLLEGITLAPYLTADFYYVGRPESGEPLLVMNVHDRVPRTEETPRQAQEGRGCAVQQGDLEAGSEHDDKMDEEPGDDDLHEDGGGHPEEEEEDVEEDQGHHHEHHSDVDEDDGREQEQEQGREEQRQEAQHQPRAHGAASPGVALTASPSGSGGATDARPSHGGTREGAAGGQQPPATTTTVQGPGVSESAQPETTAATQSTHAHHELEGSGFKYEGAQGQGQDEQKDSGGQQYMQREEQESRKVAVLKAFNEELESRVAERDQIILQRDQELARERQRSEKQTRDLKKQVLDAEDAAERMKQLHQQAMAAVRKELQQVKETHVATQRSLDEANATVLQRDAEIARLRQQLEEEHRREAVSAQLQQNLEEARASLAQKDAQISELQQQSKHNIEQVQQLRHQQEQWGAERKQLATANEQLQASLGQRDKEVAGLQHQLHERACEMVRLREALNQRPTEDLNQQQQLIAEVKLLQRKLEDSQSYLSSREAEIADHATEVAELRRQLQELVDENKKLKRKCKDVETTLSRREAEIARMSGQKLAA